MPIDTALKRRSAAASRRMPWQRRFGIAPTGSVGQATRQQATWIYAGILADVVVLGLGQLTVSRVVVVKLRFGIIVTSSSLTDSGVIVRDVLSTER